MRRRDIIMASSLGAELATEQVFGPVLERINRPLNSMADVRNMSKLCAEINDALDANEDDTPDKLWRAARRHERTKWESAHQWKCRMLDLNPATTPTLALGGMTAMNVGGWKVAVAIPSPNPMAIEHMPITEIILIDADGKAQIYKSKQPTLIEPVNVQRFTVHAYAKTWARDFARQRLEHVRGAQIARRIANILPQWHGLPPSALVIGKIGKIDWPGSDLITAGEGVDPKELARALRKPATRIHSNIFASAA